MVAGKELSPRDAMDTQRLRDYWAHGEGAAKIGWGTAGDWYRCVALTTQYLGEGAKGYCELRHQEAIGMSTAEHTKLLRGK